MENKQEQLIEDIREKFITEHKRIEKQLKRSKIYNGVTIAMFTLFSLGLSYKHYTVKQEHSAEIKKYQMELALSKMKWEQIQPYLTSIEDNIPLIEGIRDKNNQNLLKELDKEEIAQILNSISPGSSMGGGDDYIIK